jgi:hypothetical protein
MNKDQWVNEIAQSVLEIPTLEERRRDHLDFHEVHVATMKLALEMAYDAGLRAGKLASSMETLDTIEMMSSRLRMNLLIDKIFT